MAAHAGSFRTQRSGARVLDVVTAALVLGYVASTVLRRRQSTNAFFDIGVANLAYAGCVALCWLRAVQVREHRPAWTAIGASLALFTVGSLLWTTTVQFSDPVPYPSVADAFFLVFYPVAYVGVALLVVESVGTRSHAIWWDGLIAALGVAALEAAIVIAPISRGSRGEAATVATNLAYPIGDLVLVMMVVAVFAMTGWRPGRVWWTLGAGLILFSLADSIYVWRVTSDTYATGTPLDGAWLVGAFLIASAAWLGTTGHQGTWREQPIVVPACFLLSSFGIVLYSTWYEVLPLAELLAASTLLIAIARLVLAHRELQASIESRRQAEAAMRAAQQAADKANRSKSEFLSRMSHELRTPLNAVLGFAQILELQALPLDQAECVEDILKGGRHLLGLIDEVLDISRIETGHLRLTAEPVLVAELVREAVDLVASAAADREIAIVVTDPAMSAYVLADRLRARQVLVNLLSNAVKYNRRGGSVAVAGAKIGGARLRITVVDTGIGIRPEHMDRLFTPFDRLDAAQSEVEGTGIGLAHSRSLAEAMHGAVFAESVFGDGSTFTIELPQAEGPAPPTAGDPRQHQLASPARLADGRRHLVIHVEDNAANLRLMERILSRRDVDVMSVSEGRRGLELVREHRPALVLLDLHLPDMSGDEVLRRLRADPPTMSIPVVIVSADATGDRTSNVLAAGATAHLTKPLDIDALLRVVDEVLARNNADS